MDWKELIENNRAWVAGRNKEDPDYFRRLAARHEPHFLWIGCSDARVPANVVTGSDSGEMFVHRNIANQVHATDANLAAVVQYAIEALKVHDIIVVGHEDCGGVRAALGPQVPPAVEHWISQVRALARIHAEELEAIGDMSQRIARLVKLNVTEQVHNLSRLPVVQAAWSRGEELRVHGWVYNVHDGLLRDLQVSMDGRPAAESSAGTTARPSRRPASASAPELRAAG
jgi:carbonic anhydrase